MKNNEKRETIMTDEEKTEKHELNDEDLNKVAGGAVINIHKTPTCYICHYVFPERHYGIDCNVDGTRRTVCTTCLRKYNLSPYTTSELKKPRCIVCGAEDGWLTIELGGKQQPACTACYRAWKNHRL